MPTSSQPPALFRSVRFRIAAWNALAVAIIALLALVGLRQAVKWTLLREIDQILLEDMREIDVALSESSGESLAALKDELRRKSLGHKQHRWFVALRDEAGERLWASDDAPPPLELKRAQYSLPETIESLRVLRSRSPRNALGIAEAEIGSSLEIFKEDLALIDRTVAGVAILILVASPFCGYLMAGIATKDLETLTATAARLRPSHLDERLPYRGVNDEFDRLAHTINGLLDRIAAYLAEKQSFLANAAHELRTPIAAIRSSIEVALGADRTKEDYLGLLEELIEESGTLETLVNQVLLLSEASATLEQNVRGQAVISSVVGKAVEMFRGVAEQKGVELVERIEPGLIVPGNTQHLRQVVNNLIDNAIKYCHERDRVETSLRACSEDMTVVLTVQDSGPGIAAADLPHVFERFYRADRARQRNETRGTGLGLSICQTIVEAHGGTILCESEEGRGTTMTVALPWLGHKEMPAV